MKALLVFMVMVSGMNAFGAYTPTYSDAILAQLEAAGFYGGADMQGAVEYSYEVKVNKIICATRGDDPTIVGSCKIAGEQFGIPVVVDAVDAQVLGDAIRNAIPNVSFEGTAGPDYFWVKA